MGRCLMPLRMSAIVKVRIVEHKMHLEAVIGNSTNRCSIVITRYFLPFQGHLVLAIAIERLLDLPGTMMLIRDFNEGNLGFEQH